MSQSNKQKKGFWSYILWLVLMSIALVSTARGEDRALLIGVGRYAHFDDRLNGVDLDLDMMVQIAQMMGFKNEAIKVLANEQATTSNVNGAFGNWLANGVEPDERVLIYFSGHGSQVPDDNNDEKDNFDEVLLLYDTTLSGNEGRQSLAGVLHDDRFRSILSRIKSRNMLIILDACHSGSATRGLRRPAPTVPAGDAQVKYFYYSPSLEAAGGSGRFDLAQPSDLSNADSRYVALTACRDDEKTIATSKGSIFTLGLLHAVRSAAMAGQAITPEALQRQTARFIQNQIRSEAAAFHPQISGYKALRQQPLNLVALPGGNGAAEQNLASWGEKGHGTVWIKPNKTCFEPGDVLELSLNIAEPGYLTMIGISSEDRSTVMFPNPYHLQNAVKPGPLKIPTAQMEFELVSDGPPGSYLITAILTRFPVNGNELSAASTENMMATRALSLRRKKDWLAAGHVTVEFRDAGQCK